MVFMRLKTSKQNLEQKIINSDFSQISKIPDIKQTWSLFKHSSSNYKILLSDKSDLIGTNNSSMTENFIDYLQPLYKAEEEFECLKKYCNLIGPTIPISLAFSIISLFGTMCFLKNQSQESMFLSSLTVGFLSYLGTQNLLTYPQKKHLKNEIGYLKQKYSLDYGNEVLDSILKYEKTPNSLSFPSKEPI
ncbi:MAG: hypothetical protein PF569_05730 [Candidatus Woesearchaeota archaeon]|jgi:hypothetical protein|nr:hypothetical protein [Candidatus Woesearchaeota archaeon]